MAEFINKGMGTSVADFFDKVSNQYDALIKRTIPPYQEMFEAVAGYCFLDEKAPLRILELGCGTGNLSMFAASVFANSELTLVDLSPEMLHQAAEKLSAHKNRLILLEGGFLDVPLPENHYDLVISSVALHHLTDAEKPGMYQRILHSLKPGGLLRIADEVKTLPEPQAMQKNEVRWKEWAREHGATDEELAFWIDHAEKYDHYANLFDHFQWLSQAGFTEVDCYWKRVFWAVFGGRKPA